MTRTRPATRAVTAAAGIALVAAGGFGLIAQPHADAAASPSAAGCATLLIIPLGCTTSAAPSAPAPSTTAATPTPSTEPSPTLSSPSATYYSVAPSSAAPQATVTGPPPGPNLVVTRLVVTKSHGKLDALATIANTGTTVIQNDAVAVSATGVATQNWTITLSPGQHLSFHTRWGFKPAPAVKKVTVVIDPQGINAETNRADNRRTVTKRFR